MKAFFDVLKYQRQDFIKRTIFTSIAWVIIQIVFGLIGYLIRDSFTKADLIVRVFSLLCGIIVTTILNVSFMMKNQYNDSNEELK